MDEERQLYPFVLVLLMLGLVTHRSLFFWIVLVLVMILIAKPSILKPVGSSFTWFGRFVGTAVSNISLCIIFYIFIVPYGIFYRSIKKSITKSFFSTLDRTSSYSNVDRVFTKGLFEKQW